MTVDRYRQCLSDSSVGSGRDRQLKLKSAFFVITGCELPALKVCHTSHFICKHNPHKGLSDAIVVWCTERVCVCLFARICSDIQQVLREDREKLRLLQKNQPRFSEEQKKELIEVHPWIKKGSLPKAIDVKVEPEYLLQLSEKTASFIGTSVDERDESSR